MKTTSNKSRLAEAARGCSSEAEFVRLAKTRLTRIAPPTMLGGIKIEEVIAAAASGPDEGGVKNCMVYLLVNDDCSSCRLGEGLPDRPLMSMTAYVINATSAGLAWAAPRRQRKRDFWLIRPVLSDMIDANGAGMSYVVLADGLSKKQAKAGQRAVFDLLRLRRHGGFLINESRQ